MIKKIQEAFRSLKPLVRRQPYYSGIRTEQALTSVPSPSFDPSWQLEAKLKEGFIVRIKPGTKRFTLFRFLLAKLVYDDYGLSIEEYLAMYTLYYDFQDLKDPSFILKYGDWFERTTPFFIDLAQVIQFPVRLSIESSEQILPFLLPVIPSKRVYFGLKGQRDLRTSFCVQLVSALPPQRIKSKRYVGVGYRDKGTRRDLAKNGNPSWQEVAHHYYEVERRAEKEFILDEGHLGPPDESKESKD